MHQRKKKEDIKDQYNKEKKVLENVNVKISTSYNI